MNLFKSIAARWNSRNAAPARRPPVSYDVYTVGVGGPVPAHVAALALDRLERIDHPGLDDAASRPIIADIQTVLGFWPTIHKDVMAPNLHRIVTNRRVRGQTENCRLHRIAELKYPPREKCGLGRANWKQDSVFYGALSYVACMAEVDPQAGDLVTHSEWEPIAMTETLSAMMIFESEGITAEIPFLRDSVKHMQRLLETEDPETARTIRRVSKFMTTQFTRPTTTENRMEYLVSAVVSKHFIGLPGPIDAIIYPSVALRLADLNVAVRPDSFDRVYYLRRAKEILVSATCTPHSWAGRVTAVASRQHFNKQEITWDDVRLPEDGIAQLGS